MSRFVKSVLTFFVLLVVSTSVNALGHEWGEDDGSKWVNGFAPSERDKKLSRL